MMCRVVVEISDGWVHFCVLREAGRGLTRDSLCGTAMDIAKTTYYHSLFLCVLFRFKVRMSRKNLHFSSSSGPNFFPKMCLRNSSKRSQG